MDADNVFRLAAGVLDDGAVDLLHEHVAGKAIDAVSAGDLAAVRSDAYPDTVKAYALRVWTFEAGRNAAKATRIVNERAGLSISVDTVRSWIHRDDWDRLAGELHQTLDSVLLGATKAGLARLSVLAVQAIEDVLSDADASPTAKVRAASLALGLRGFVPPLHGNTVNVAVSVGNDRYAEMSDEELRDAAAAYRPDPEHTPPPQVTDAEYRIAHNEHGSQPRVKPGSHRPR